MNLLITGGTGSFGHAMTRRLLADGAQRIVIYSRDEVKQDAMRAAFGNDPRLRFFLGDVRDLPRLRRALADVSVVYHAAALKRVPQCEYDPEEAIKTNILGSLNVCNAAIDAGVSAVVALSTDKACLDYHTRVLTNQGALPISRIVRERMRVKVWAFDGHTFGWRDVVEWHQTPLKGRRMFRLSYENQHTNPKAGATRLLLTEDHPVLTPNGWVEAQYIRNGELIATGEPAPNDTQMEVIVGTVLGDASLTPPRNGGRSSLVFGHAEAQREWFDIKCRALADIGLVEKAPTQAARGRQKFLRATTRTLASLSVIRGAFYPEARKSVPRSLVERHFGPRLLAAWFLDDGCCSDGTIRIATHGFDRDDVKWLATLLSARGYAAKAYEWRGGYWELRVGVEGAKRMCADIGAFVPPSLRYKLPHPSPDYDSSLWETGPSTTYFAKAVIGEEVGYKSKDVYCLGVEGVHNFLANGIVVHNCQPTNLYGATKLCVEKLVVAANAYAPGRTRLMALRYGNVAGSRGSVIPLWRETRWSGWTMTDPSMTRFWITLSEAVDLARRATLGHGGEVFIPRLPAYTLGDLAEAMQIEGQRPTPDNPAQMTTYTVMHPLPPTVTGLRPGEKRHEAMLSEDELALARDYGTHLCLHPTHPWVAQRTDGVPVTSPLTSDTAPRLTVPDLVERLKNV